MKIGIVNDVAMATEALRRVIASTSEHEVAWTARNGREAVILCASSLPDLVLMDLSMPEMDGVEATRSIMQATPCAILIVTGRPQDNPGVVFRALGAGALDVTATPILAGEPDGGAELLAKIKTIGKLVRAAERQNHKLVNPNPPGSAAPESGIKHLIALGASTGGPVAIARMLGGWTMPASAAMVVVQHIDEHFAGHFAKWLGEQTPMPVRVIEAGESLHAGAVHIARTNDHLHMDARRRLFYSEEPRDYAYRPSVDVFFHCLARHWQREATGVLLTGMGRDGADGLLAMRAAGYHTLTQDQASCTVYGMPRAAAELNAASEILGIDAISSVLRARIGAM